MRLQLRILLLLPLLLAWHSATASTTIVYGKDSTYIGQKLQLYSWDDGWNYNKTLLDSCHVNADGSFRFKFSLSETRKAYIHLGKYNGCLFVEPGKTYHINLPLYEAESQADLLNPYYQPQELLLSFTNLAKDDLNMQIAAFEDAFDHQWALLLKQQPITPQHIEHAIANIDSICPATDNLFMQQYRNYRYALMVNLYATAAPNLSIKTYFLQQPVLYHQPAYWEAFEAIFPHFDHLTGLYGNLPLFELAIMQKVEIGDLPIEKLTHIQTASNKKIATAMQQKKSSVTEGHTIAIDKLINIHGDTIIWKDLNFPQAYIIFANTKLNESLADIDYIQKIGRKYKDKCLFLLIFTDQDIHAIQQACQHLTNHYFVVSTQQNPQLVHAFQQTHAPSYFVLDANSRLIKVPAPRPKDFTP